MTRNRTVFVVGRPQVGLLAGPRSPLHPTEFLPNFPACLGETTAEQDQRLTDIPVAAPSTPLGPRFEQGTGD
jgi:hypothetical protein